MADMFDMDHDLVLLEQNDGWFWEIRLAGIPLTHGYATTKEDATDAAMDWVDNEVEG